MRQNNNSGRRSRGRGGNQGNQGNNGNRRPANRMQVFDSNGPEVRIRGTAHQVCDKYLAMAKDAMSTGDRVVAETYFQYAEHYQRIINSWNEENTQKESSNSSEVKSKEVKSNVSEADLSLPASIIGNEVDVNSDSSVEISKTEKELEDA